MTEQIFWGRTYGLDFRVEREADGTLGVYGSVAYAAHDTLLANGSTEEPVGRFDMSGGLLHRLEQRLGIPLASVYTPQKRRSASNALQNWGSFRPTRRPA